jgi:prolyl oligopeptidase
MKLLCRGTLALSLFATSLLWALDFQYPQTRKSEHVDEYHGVRVEDPYQWLEQDVRVSEEVRRWMDAQNEVTFAYLESIQEREEIRDRLTALWDYERISAPSKVADFYVFSRNDGLQNQSVVYTQPKLGADAQLLLDPNQWSEDGTVALSGLSFSDDGRYAAYSRSAAGSDWREFRVLDVATRETLPDKLEWIKFSGVSWTPDGKGFFYSRFPEPEDGAEFQSLNLNSSIWYHRAGTAQSEDVLVFHQPDHPEWTLGARVSEDGRYLFVSASKGTDRRNRLWIRDLTEPYALPTPLIDNFDHDWTPLGNDGPIGYFRTDFEAPNGRIVQMDMRTGLESLRELIPEREEPLRSVNLVGNLFACSYLKDVLPLVRLHRIDGSYLRDVTFPGIGSVSGFGGRRSHTETFYTFSSYATPPSIYRYDLLTGESELFRRPQVDFDPDDYEVHQIFYQSKDGTRVPMFVSHRKGIRLDGGNPALLHGYGGFNITQTPGFSQVNLAWMEMGGVYAVPNIRGGGEYGKAWHQAGTRLNKQHVFDDFIAAAEWLIENGYTRSEKLAISGGSNGGLLVGAAMTQKPELFGAALPAVGVMDMLKFHRWTAGRFWVDDYGSSENPEEFKALYAYSPYHNLRPGVQYPATLVTTADTDDRVVPGHSFKFAARLQEVHTGSAPVLIRIQTRAGHGAGKPTMMRIEEAADRLAFLVRNLKMEAAPPLVSEAR